MRKSDLLIQTGDFQFALAQNMEVYREYHDPLGDRALFQIGLLYAHPQNPDANHAEAIRAFEKIAEEFPHSKIRNEAEVFSHILRTVTELKESLDSLETTYGQLETTYGQSRKTLSQLEKEVGEKKKKIAQYHKTASNRKAAIEHLNAQLLDLQRRLEQMEAQLSDLKKIDLMMEERRRSLP